MLLDPEKYPTLRIPVRHGMEPLHLTPANDDDFEFVRLVHREAMYDSLSHTMGWQDEAQLEWLTAAWKAEEVWLLWSGGRRAGFLQLKENGEGLFLNLLCLKAAFQRRGIGHLLLSHLLQLAGQERRPIRLHVLKGSRARRLYEHFGFEPVGENEHQDFFLWTPVSGQFRPSRETERAPASSETRRPRSSDSERSGREARPRPGAAEGRSRPLAAESRSGRTPPRPEPIAPAEQAAEEAPEAPKSSARPPRARRPRSAKRPTPAPEGTSTAEATAEGTGAESHSKRPSRGRRNRRRGRGKKGGGEQAPPADGTPGSPSEPRVA